jgi:branched-chain amino acid aminotransferase
MSKVWINGQLFDKSEAKVSVFDHGLLYGDGVFEGIRIYNGKPFRLREHIDRLFDSARHILLEIPLNREQLTQAVLDTVQADAHQEGYIRLVVTRGPGTLGLDPNKCTNPQVIIIVDDITLYPAEFYEKGLRVLTASVIRNHPNALNPRIKSLNYLNNILARIEADRAGCQEAIMLNHNGEVAECTADNIFLVKHGVLRTPHLAAGILEGVTRNLILELARQAKIPVQEMALTRHDVLSADECFLTGTAAEVAPIVECDGRPIGNGKPGPITRQLRERYQQFVRQTPANASLV